MRALARSVLAWLLLGANVGFAIGDVIAQRAGMAALSAFAAGLVVAMIAIGDD